MTKTTAGQVPARPAHRPTSRAAQFAVIAAIALAVLAVGIAGTRLALHAAAPQPGATVDLRGNLVALDPGEAAAAPQQDAVPRGEGRFQIPAVGLDVPLGALSEAGGVITPPGFTSVYRVRNRGVDTAHAADGTVFVVTHSLRDGGVAPGNYLIDVAHGRAAVQPGAVVVVDGVDYTVDAAVPLRKSDLSTDSQVWENTPDRLVIITCLQVPANTPSVDNLVITATRAG